jgi:hypothetical protein
MLRPIAACVLLSALAFALPVRAQTAPDFRAGHPTDVASPEAIVTAAYASLDRRPGDPFDWDRFRSLFYPRAVLLPNTEQTGGTPRTFSPDEFAAWVDERQAEYAPIGGPKDRGFTEEELRSEVQRYGDVAHVLSTYQKRFWDDERVLGRGVNSFQLVHREGRWWIVSIAWDEEVGAGPLPPDLVE